jgi:hypothetical protein
MNLKDFLEKYCDSTIAISVTDSWGVGESTFDYRGFVDDITENREINGLYGDKIVKSIDVYNEILYILVE